MRTETIKDGGAEQEGAAEGAPAASGGLDDPPEQPKTNSVPSSSGPGYQPPTRTIATWEDGQIQQPSREDAASIRLPNRTSSAPSDNQREQLSSSAGLPPPGARADIPAAGRIDDG